MRFTIEGSNARQELPRGGYFRRIGAILLVALAALLPKPVWASATLPIGPIIGAFGILPRPEAVGS
jgi:hypothetical protein